MQNELISLAPEEYIQSKQYKEAENVAVAQAAATGCPYDIWLVCLDPSKLAASDIINERGYVKEVLRHPGNFELEVHPVPEHIRPHNMKVLPAPVRTHPPDPAIYIRIMQRITPDCAWEIIEREQERLLKFKQAG